MPLLFMKIIAVVAAAQNDVIGIENKMPWHLPDDFKHFKSLTSGHIILMGRNTWESIGEKPLPNRKNWILTSKFSRNDDQVRTFSNIESAISTAQELNADKLFVIGGSQVYNATMDLIDTIVMTRVHTTIEGGDAFFPKIDPNKWVLTANVLNKKDDKHPFDFSFETWEKLM